MSLHAVVQRRACHISNIRNVCRSHWSKTFALISQFGHNTRVPCTSLPRPDLQETTRSGPGTGPRLTAGSRQPVWRDEANAGNDRLHGYRFWHFSGPAPPESLMHCSNLIHLQMFTPDVPSSNPLINCFYFPSYFENVRINPTSNRITDALLRQLTPWSTHRQPLSILLACYECFQEKRFVSRSNEFRGYFSRRWPPNKFDDQWKAIPC